MIRKQKWCAKNNNMWENYDKWEISQGSVHPIGC